MSLNYYYKDSRTKEIYYFDTDDLNDEEYARVYEIDKKLALDLSMSEFIKLQDEKRRIIKGALYREYLYHN